MNKKTYIIIVLALAVISFGASYSYGFKHANPFADQIFIPETNFEIWTTSTNFDTATDQLIISTYDHNQENSLNIDIENARYLDIGVHSKNNVEIYGGETPQQAIESEPLSNCGANSVCNYTPESIEKYYVISGDGKINVRTIAANSLEDEQNQV